MRTLERIYATAKYVLLPIAAGIFIGACLQYYLKVM